ncbi:hypothetical protein BH24CHL6_BH24CHL6_01230 [soil metagenome]
MIKNAVLHPVGEQPMLVDLLVSPKPSDISLLCTNLRTIDGKKPRSVDKPDGLFVIPLGTLRFVEVPGNALAATIAGLAGNGQTAPASSTQTLPSSDDEMGMVTTSEHEHHSVLPDPGEVIELEPGDLLDDGAEPDEELLRRIREV